MIRRDYILRMIEEFAQAIARLQSLKKGQRWQEAAGAVDEEFQRLTGGGAQAVAQLTETELLARLMKGEPAQVVRDKTLILSRMLKEAGEIADAQGRNEESLAYYLKGLHLLLEVLGRGEVFEQPAFVPKVEEFVTALQERPVPMSTLARLMHHYERAEEFGKAEDALFAMFDCEPDNPRLLEFGMTFYERVAGQSDASLARGNLPRAELDAGLESLRQRATAGAAAPT